MVIAIVPVCLQEVFDFGGIAQIFKEGAHHPTVLVVLQALTTTVGEVQYYCNNYFIHNYIEFFLHV